MYLSAAAKQHSSTAPVYEIKEKTTIFLPAADLWWLLSASDSSQQHATEGNKNDGVEMKYRSIMYKNRFWRLVVFLNMGDSGQSLLGKQSLSYILTYTGRHDKNILFISTTLKKIIPFSI